MRKRTLQGLHGITCGLFGTGFNQIGNGFGLGQIQLVIEKGPFAEFTGAGQTGTAIQTGLEQHIHDHRAAVTVQLQHVFTGKGVRAGKVQGQPLVDDPVAMRQCAVMGVAWGGRETTYLLGYLQCMGAGNTHDTHPTLAGGSGDGGDGVGVVLTAHVRFLLIRVMESKTPRNRGVCNWRGGRIRSSPPPFRSVG